MDPAGEVGVHGENGSEEYQENEDGAGRLQGRSCRVGGELEALDPIQGSRRGEPPELLPDIRRGGGLGWIIMEGTSVVPTAVGAAEALSFDLRTA